MVIDPRLAILFAVVAEERSFTRAAARLNLAQPWLSAQIRKLEDQLGYQLFFRDRGPIELTPEGERLFPVALELTRGSERLRDTARAISADVAQAVRVGAHASSAGLPAFARLNDEFTAKFRENSLVVTPGITADLIGGVIGGRLDAAVVLEPFDRRGLDVIVLRELAPYLLLPKDSPLALYDELAPDDLAGYRLGTIPRHTHPEFFDALYKPLVESGAILKPVSETQIRAMEHFVRFQGVGVVMIEGDLENYLRDDGLIARPLIGTVVRYALVKRDNVEKRALGRYWRLAQTLSTSAGKAAS